MNNVNTPEQTTSIVLNPQTQIDALKSAMEIMRQLYEDKQVLRPDTDYGIIPGTSKPTLLQPGAEKLMRAFRLRPRLTTLSKEIERDTNWIFYEYRAEIIEIDTGDVIGVADGSCNSFEDKYRWRTVAAHEVPANLDKSELEMITSSAEEFTFAYEKRETTGQYGKPEEYWQAFDEAIENGTAHRIKKTTRNGKEFDAYRIESTAYRIPNPKIWDQLNTISKMAQKRAMMSAVKAAVGASEYFTVDIEDMAEFNYTPATSSVKVEKPAVNITEAEIVDELSNKTASGNSVDPVEYPSGTEKIVMLTQLEIQKDRKPPLKFMWVDPVSGETNFVGEWSREKFDEEHGCWIDKSAGDWSEDQPMTKLPQNIPAVIEWHTASNGNVYPRIKGVEENDGGTDKAPKTNGSNPFVKSNSVMEDIPF